MNIKTFLSMRTASLLAAATVGCIVLSGCAAMAQMAAQQRAEQRAERAQLRAEIAALSPQERAMAEQCSSMSIGRIRALRIAGQGEYTFGANTFSIVQACINNPYYFETIPKPTAVTVRQAPSYCTQENYGYTSQIQCNSYPY